MCISHRATEDIEARVELVDGARDRIPVYLAAVGTALAAASEQLWPASTPSSYREVYKRNVQIDAVFAADLTTTMMVRIQQGEVRANTGLDDAPGYHELASFITAGNQRVGRRHVFHSDRRQSVADLPQPHRAHRRVRDIIAGSRRSMGPPGC